MFIKKEKPYHLSLFLSFIILFFAGGSYLFFQEIKNRFIISYEVVEHDSLIHIIVKKEGYFGKEPIFTFLNEKNEVKNIKVEGAKFHSNSPLPLIHYPPPQNESFDYPKARIFAVSTLEKTDYQWDEAQFKTFTKDNFPLRVVSLIGSRHAFFGKQGFYSVKRDDPTRVNPEHTLYVEILDKGGQSIFSAPVKAHVGGGASKRLPMKSLDLHFFDRAISSQMIFENAEEKQINSFRLRNAGNDFMLAYMRDVVVSELVSQTHLIQLDFQPVVVFINGEYWGIQYIREHITKKNISSMYSHLPREKIILGELYENRSISNTNGFDYKMEQLMELIETADFSLPEKLAQLNSSINLDNFIDYIVLQTFISNRDWPHNNVKGVFLNHQLHFILYDTDLAFDFPLFYKRHTDDIFNMPEWYHSANSLTYNYFNDLDHHLPSHVGRIYAALIQYDFFRERFVNRYYEMLEGHFSQSQIEKIVKDIKTQIEPLMPSHIARWGYPKSIEDWHLHTEQIINFCAERRVHVSNQLKQLEKIFVKNN